MNAGKPLPISLLVLTYNEAPNIARCLDSVAFAQEKLVIDCGSTDATAEIARARGARVVQQPWLGFGLQRRAASALASHPWILFLDADEWLSGELQAEFARRLPQLLDSGYAGAYLLRSAWFMGARMQWYRPLARERIERVYHRERAQWTESSVHEALVFNGPAIELRSPLLHAYTPSLVQRGLKDLYYAELRAREWNQRGRRGRIWLAPIIFLVTFLKDYVLRLAALDGARGYVAAHLAASYAVYKRLRCYEMAVHPESIELARAALVRHGLERKQP
ncbi:MAG TPA: glycosyltransferase family 2 protein [Steroidobacteraceae bacterium]|nr:glycosyltransferase family 2 protein [Steroidobacteraceae bacterium]